MNVRSDILAIPILTLAIVMTLNPVLGMCQQSKEPSGGNQVGDAERETQTLTVWHATLDDAVKDAAKTDKPIFVIVGAEWCVFCKKLEEQINSEVADKLAETWVLAKIDADARVSDARELRANGLPSLRLLSKDGVIVSSHDGYLETDALMAWLDESFDAVDSNVPEMLEIDPADYSDQQISELFDLIATRDVTVRRIIIDRLSKVPDRCVVKTIDLLSSKRLADQLSALQLLRLWKAPVEGLDPWIPKTIDGAAVRRLREWRKQSFPDASIET
jgi:thiol-disulfide isomerase/thioredoxin